MKQELLEKLRELAGKYEAMGQDMESYLEGLLYADYLTYWDYIQLETLLSLQKPKTPFPDEMIFIGYHQIAELYFKLVLHELKQLCNEKLNQENVIEKLRRVIRYFTHLTLSFHVMEEGMDREQFLKFRMALLPSSGFQSAQFRMIEFHCTRLVNLLSEDYDKQVKPSLNYEKIYWKSGATELKSGKKTLTLKQFEKAYDHQFIQLIQSMEGRTLEDQYIQNPDWQTENITSLLKELDQYINIDWRLAHYRSAVHHLKKPNNRVQATGGTNWQQYLPPRFQRIIFFPDIWSSNEKMNWGKKWVEEFLS